MRSIRVSLEITIRLVFNAMMAEKLLTQNPTGW
jgi:hypothetical protein